MLFRIFLLLLLLAPWLNGFTQSRKIDSLTLLIQKSNDHQKADALNAYAYAISSYDYQKAQNAIAEAINLSNQLGYEKGLAEAFLYKGIIGSNIGRDSLSVISFRKSLAYSAQGSDKALRGRIYTAIALAHQTLDQLDSAQFFYGKAYQMLRDSTSPLNLSFLYLNLAQLHDLQNNQRMHLLFLQRSWEIRKRLNESHAQVWTGVGLAAYYTQYGDYPKALSFLDTAQKALKADTLESEEIAIIDKQRGIIYANQGRHAEALDLFARAKKYYERNPYLWDLVNLLSEIGYVQVDVSNYEIGLKYYFLALKYSEVNRFEHQTTRLYFRIAWVYYMMEQNSLSQEFCEKALSAARQHHHQLDEASSLNLLGLLSDRKKMYDEALEYFNQALDLRQRNNYRAGIASTLLNIGVHFEKINKFTQAEEFELKSLSIEKELNHAIGMCFSYQALGELYRKRKDYKTATNYLAEGEALSKKIKASSLLLDMLRTRRDVYADQLQFQYAHEYSRRYENLKDSLLTTSLANRVLTLQHDYELDQKDKEIKILNQQQALQQNTLELKQSQIDNQRTIIIVGVLGLIGTLIFAYVIFGFYRKVKDLNKSISEQNEEITAQSEELREANEVLADLNKEVSEKNEEIQAQAEELTESNQTIARINEGLEEKIKQRTSELKEAYHELDTFFYRSSHDFRRPLTTFMGLAEVAKVSVKEPAALELFEKVRTTASNLDKMLSKLQSVNLISGVGLSKTEVDFKDLFASELHLFHDELLKKKIIARAEVRVSRPLLSQPALLKVVIQNLIENAIAFSSNDKPEIHLSAMDAGGEVRLQVTDNGQGIESPYLPRVCEMYFRANEKSSGNGLGLYIVKKMIDKLNGRIEIESEVAKGTVVKIFLPH